MHEAGFVILRDGTRRRAVNPRCDLADDPVAAPVRYLAGHARLSATASWTLLWSSRAHLSYPRRIASSRRSVAIFNPSNGTTQRRASIPHLVPPKMADVCERCRTVAARTQVKSDRVTVGYRGVLNGCEQGRTDKNSRMAPRAGFEPATIRLTVECSTAELPRNRRNPTGFATGCV
jgi:hypothetical protein